MVLPKALTPQDTLSISEFADLFGFTPSAMLAAIEHQRGSYTKPFYSIEELADRWICSRATVYAVLKETEFKVFDLAHGGKKKGPKRIPVAVVQKIEQSRMKTLAA
jgi:predicted DNA-binding protein YlxM (UPF0122 family)